MKAVLQSLQAQFNKMCATGKLFQSSISGYSLVNTYLEGFGDDSIYRDPQSSVHNCNLCKNFLHRYANIVALDENMNIMTLFDGETTDEFKNSFALMSERLKNAPIQEVFVETYEALSTSLIYERPIRKDQAAYKLGVESNVKRYTKEEAEKFGVVKPNQIVTFQHLSLIIPREFIDFSSQSVESIRANYRVAQDIFKKAMDNIPTDTLILVRDLINQGSLLDGQTHLHKVEAILKKAEEYKNVPADKRSNWCWVNSYKFQYAMFKNELIGKFCSDLAEGLELNEACREWNIRVDPANYMRATAPITKKQIEEAQKFVEENGYTDSFNRRCATIEDIKASDILHLNAGTGEMKKVSIFDGVKATPTRHRKSEFDQIETVTIEKFMKDILPGCTSVEAFLLNQHKGNMVSLTTSVNKESKPIFKWSNNYSWSYNGNMAGKSQIKEEVKKAGGTVDAPFRFSIMWNEDGRDIVDLDAHCVEQSGYEIFYRNRGRISPQGGTLDVDMIRPTGRGVENIYYKNVPDGTYRFFIHNYDGRHHKNCKAEIYIDGTVYEYLVDHCISGSVDIATVTIQNGVVTNIKQSRYLVGGNEISTELYGLETNQFHKVNLICLSPNHWDDNVGNKHYFFMLEGCKSPTQIRGFFNENLIPELLQHRKVMEVLANTCMVESTDKQLSGLGFNATVRDELIVRLKGSHNRVIKIQF